ncbi:G-protein coupled receptor Mth2-like [Pogonomyrmex barbatus]|uniref:G-protein coupled receptor Mth2-like n=1 Tax=Pogonomyrmex barbatus TaxID=144034 RepID=A0A6I9W0K9_9HYME|nr:G-protein coupled receptor Mth2-like [Pogonomyrmex barbatus]
MFTKRLVLFALVLSSTGVSSESHLSKCCPPGKIFSEHSILECVSVPKNAKELHHWNITAAFQGVPQCDELENLVITPLNVLDSDKFLEVPTCLEIYHKQTTGESIIIVVHCLSNKDRQSKAINASLPQVAYVRKCCPYDTIYDSHRKACVSPLKKSESFVTFLLNKATDTDVVITTEGPPTCKGPIVDYEINENDIFLRNNPNSSKVMVPAFKNATIKEELLLTEDTACLEMTPNSVFNRTLAVRICRDSEFCDRNVCIRKCCAENEFLYAGRCNKTVTPDQPIEFSQALANAMSQTKSSTFDTAKDYGIVVGNPCKNEAYAMDSKKQEWLLTSEGYVFFDNDIYNESNYCMDVYYNVTFDYNFYLFMCFIPPIDELPVSTQVILSLQLANCIFLLMTLLIYTCLPSLQNVHGKTLMCHVGSFSMTYACALVYNLSIYFKLIEQQHIAMTSTVLGYVVLFNYLSAYTWLNVMCFDIWWTFGVLRESTIPKAHKHRKRFRLYCAYAWGLSLVVTILTIIADRTDILPYYLQPGIGIRKCWFIQLDVKKDENSYGELVFFTGPVLILLLSNVRFFILTLSYCNKVKAEIKKMTMDPEDPKSKRYHSDKKKFLMNVKLFIVMGISWNNEVVSCFLVKCLKYEYWNYVFFTNESVNCLQGILVFTFLILKNRVYRELRRRLGLDTKKKPIPICNATITLDGEEIKKNASNDTLMTTLPNSTL